jgi:hypothetical protein
MIAKFTACVLTAVTLLIVEALSPVRASAATPATAGQSVKIAFAGDSIVDNYWSGVAKIVSANACLKANIELGRFAKNGTGLTRGDRLYWPREIRRIVETFKPAVLVLSIGLNDRQFIVDGDGHHTAWGAPDWLDKYRTEIVSFLRGASVGSTVVLLIGLPTVRDAAEDADLKAKNAMYADAIAEFGNDHFEFVEPWKLNPSSATDPFASYGRDTKGRTVQLRTGDGEHFTDAGEDVVAAYLFPKIIAAADRGGTQLDGCFSPQADAVK